MPGRVLNVLRGLAFAGSVAAIIAAQWLFNSVPRRSDEGWTYMLVAVIAAFLWQLPQSVPDQLRPQQRQYGWSPARWRWALGGSLIAAAAVWYAYATWALSMDYEPNFDFSWLSWFGATAVMSIGLRLLQVRLGPPALPMARWEWAALAAIQLLGVAYHLGNFQNFPPGDAVSQIEELQTGMFGTLYLEGARNRWEFASWAVFAALGLWIGGPSMLSVRLPFAILNVLKIIPAYFLFRALAGRTAAVFGTLLLAVCGWDSILTRIPSHADHLATMIGFALMAGPAVRGSWAAYPWIGFISGFTSWSYIVFRPFIGFALAGSAFSAWAHPGGTRARKLLRATTVVLLVAALTVGIFYPLTHKLQGRFMHEYMDGWNRAHAQTHYYTPNDTWQSTLRKRWERVARVANLFYTVGDENPTHNPDARPTIDPVAGSFLVLGLGYGLAHCLRGFYAIALASMMITITGTLIATGNLDCLRGQAAINSVYIVIAIGVGSFAAAAQTYLGKAGKYAACIALCGAITYAGYWNAKLLLDLWSSPVTQEHYRNDIAYLSDWLRRHASGIPVIGLVPSGANVVFQPNDGAWLRGKNVHGESTWDIQTTWRKLRDQTEPTMLLIATPSMNRDIIAYFEEILPGTKFTRREEATVHGTRMGSAVIDPQELAKAKDRITTALCSGTRARFSFHYLDGSSNGPIEVLAPFIDHSSWPGQVRNQSWRDHERLDHVSAQWQADFVISEAAAGEYTFRGMAYEGVVEMKIDAKVIPASGSIYLGPGTHHFSVSGDFRPAAVEQSMRVTWQKRDGTEALFPLFRLVPPDPACLEREALTHHP